MHLCEREKEGKKRKFRDVLYSLILKHYKFSVTDNKGSGH